MGKPIATTSGGVCFAFPNVCSTQSGAVTVPIPYPSIGQLMDADLPESNVFAGGSEVITKAGSISDTTGDSAGLPNDTGGAVSFEQGSGSVFVKGSEVVRLLDRTKQNDRAVGSVLGGFPTVLVGD